MQSILAPAGERPATIATLDCERVLELMLTQRGNPVAEIERVLAGDSQSVCGHCLRTALIVRADDVGARSTLAASVMAIEQACPEAGSLPRRHAAAARAWLDGDVHLAAAQYGAIVADWPGDVLALLVAQALDFRLGRRQLMASRFARVLPAWTAVMPGYASVLAMYAFALEENTQYRLAEETARRALALDPQHPGAIHVIAHVMEMQGRTCEGLAFLSATESAWAKGTGLSVHLAWHRALFQLESGDAQSALETYDRQIASAPASDFSALADASALLWRLELQSTTLRERWQLLADRWEAQMLVGARVFYVVHAVMAFAVARRTAEATRLLELLKRNDPNLESTEHSETGLAKAFCEALLAFTRRDYVACVEWLKRVRHIGDQCGGSLAQCDLIHLTFTEAALRARRMDSRGFWSRSARHVDPRAALTHCYSSASQYRSRSHRGGRAGSTLPKRYGYVAVATG